MSGSDTGEHLARVLVSPSRDGLAAYAVRVDDGPRGSLGDAGHPTAEEA